MGKLIVLEGLDGSGKGTQTELLREYLEERGKCVCVLDFPAYGTPGAALVELYLNGGLGECPDDTNAYAASMFFAADRYVSFVREWRSAYEDEDTVLIANRYTTANAYHQLSKLPESEWDSFLEWLWNFEFERLGLPSPDRVLLLDMPGSVSEAMVYRRSSETGARLDIHEKDGEYLRRCRRAAHYVAEKYAWSVIRCADEGMTEPFSRDEIAHSIREAISDIVDT